MRLSLRSRHLIANALYVGLLMLYVLAGIRIAPYHGDESTIIHKAHDWYFLVSGNIRPLLYSPTPADPAEQELRLVNGVTSAYGIGLMAMLMGLPDSEIPEQWLWGADWNYNLVYGHMPSDRLLFAARLSSALMTVISIALIFAFTKRLHSTVAAWVASLLYTLTPAVLLNGRRAMFEGANLLAISLILMAGFAVVYWIYHDNNRRLIRSWLLFGLASGFGMASKHILIILIIPVALALLILFIITHRDIVRAVFYTAMAGITAFVFFFMLNPAWWSAPLQTANEVAQLRRKLVEEQGAFYGRYTQIQDQLIALFNTPIDSPQYYESTLGWPEWIGGQIQTYGRSGLGGIEWGVGGIIGLIVRLALLLLLLRAHWWNSAYLLVFALTFIFDLIAIFFLTPLPWQRYYLPLAALWAITYAVALTTGIQFLWSKYAR